MTDSPPSSPPPSPRPPRSSLGAAGIAVSDLGRSVDFYRQVFGMVELMKLRLPDMDEVILGFEGGRGAAVVLMQYTDGSTNETTGHPVKLVFYVPDPTATAAAIRAAGGEVTLEPAPIESLGNAVVGFALDPDHHKLELLPSP